MTTPDLPSGPPPGVGLGRQFEGHDPRSRNFGVRPLLELRQVTRAPRVWRLPSPPSGQRWPLNQLGEGACEAFGLAHELALGPVEVQDMTDEWAFGYYERIRLVDREFGRHYAHGATTIANMIAAKREGRITGYRWTFGVDDMLDTVTSVGPVCIGVNWYDGMYRTRADGLVEVTGQLVGGHFIVVVGYDVHPVHGPCFLWLNSWGDGYGVGDERVGVEAGIGWVPVPTMARLMAEDGEGVVPADFFAAPPTPPTPAPEPAPAPPPLDPARAPFFARNGSRVFHDRHWLVPRHRGFTSYGDAVAAGLTPCRVCRPDRAVHREPHGSVWRRWFQ